MDREDGNQAEVDSGSTEESVRASPHQRLGTSLSGVEESCLPPFTQFICMSALSAFLCVCHLCAWCQKRSE